MNSAWIIKSTLTAKENGLFEEMNFPFDLEPLCSLCCWERNECHAILSDSNGNPWNPNGQKKMKRLALRNFISSVRPIFDYNRNDNNRSGCVCVCVLASYSGLFVYRIQPTLILCTAYPTINDFRSVFLLCLHIWARRRRSWWAISNREGYYRIRF